MTIAQARSLHQLEASGARVSSNESVFQVLERMPSKQGTYKEIIAFVAGERQMTAVEGNALSAPIIRALSELASEGLIDASQVVVNEDTGRVNTLYRVLDKPNKQQPAKQTWKDKALALEAELKELKAKYHVACQTIDRLEKK